MLIDRHRLTIWIGNLVRCEGVCSESQRTDGEPLPRLPLALEMLQDLRNSYTHALLETFTLGTYFKSCPERKVFRPYLALGCNPTRELATLFSAHHDWTDFWKGGRPQQADNKGGFLWC